MKLDRELEYGFSRQLSVEVLQQMELMTEKERKEFLEKSGYRKSRNKMMNSLGMKEYLEMLEGKFEQGSGSNPAKEIELVDKYVKLIEENKTSFIAKAMPLIRFEEMTPYEHSQRQRRRDAR